MIITCHVLTEVFYLHVKQPFFIQVLNASLLISVTPIHVMELQHVSQIPLDDIGVTAKRDGLGKIAVLTLMNAQLVVFHRVTMAAHVSTHLDHSYAIVFLVGKDFNVPSH